MTRQPIAIVGRGGVFPGAATLDAFWANVAGGTVALRPVPAGRWAVPAERAYAPGGPSPDRAYSLVGGYLDELPDDFDGLGVPAETLRVLDPLFRLTVLAGREAYRDARMAKVDPRRVGVILGNLALPTEHASNLCREVLGRLFYNDDREATGRFHEWDRTPAGMPAFVLAAALRIGGIDLSPSPPGFAGGEGRGEGGRLPRTPDRQPHAGRIPPHPRPLPPQSRGEREPDPYPAPVFTLDAACASSLYALKLAADALDAGHADAILAGGVSRPDCQYTQMGFSQLRALSPTGRCSPFGAAADGLVVGEGAGVFVLKRLADALAHGDTVHGVICGVGVSNDIEGNVLAPAQEGQLRAMRAAYADAGWVPSSVDVIECHATGTPLGDRTEFRSMRALWGDAGWQPGQCAVGTVKAQIGHLLTGAGAAGVMKVLLAMEHGQRPPMPHGEPAVEIAGSPFRILSEPEPWAVPADRPRRAAVSAFGFGGINAHVLIEQFDPKRHKVRDRQPQPRPAVCVVAADVRSGPFAGLDAERRLCGTDDSDVSFKIDAVPVALGRYRIPPSEVRQMLPQQALALESAAAAVDQAGLGDAARAGVFVGGRLDLNTTNYHFRWTRPDAERDAAGPSLTADRTLGGLLSVAASRVARAFGVGGPSFVVQAEELSGERAVEIAADAVQRGELDRALVAAVDFATDMRLGRAAANPADAAAAVILMRLADAERDGIPVLAVLDDTHAATPYRDITSKRLGHGGAASGLVGLAAAALCLRRRVLPGDPPQYWLNDAAVGPRRALTLRDHPGDPPPAFDLPEAVFLLRGDTPDQLRQAATALLALANSRDGDGVSSLARRWHAASRPAARTAAVVAATATELRESLASLASHLTDHADQPADHRDRVFYTPAPLGGEVAFLFPGSGNVTPGMGRELAAAFPFILDLQQGENARLRTQYDPARFWTVPPTEPVTPAEAIFGQVTLGTLVSDLLRAFGVEPQAALGVSLGQSASLFGLRAWTARDEMLHRLERTTLFAHELGGECFAARRHWRLKDHEPFEWRTALLAVSAERAQEALRSFPRVVVQIVTAPGECVVGGPRAEVDAVAELFGVVPLVIDGVTIAHSPIIEQVCDEYRSLHYLPVTPSAVRWYSEATGEPYLVTSDSAADAVLWQALGTIDVPRLVERAYADGVRLFVEVGPGASFSRTVTATLGGRPHVARSATPAGASEVGSVLRLLGALASEGVAVDLGVLYDGAAAETAERKTVSVPAPRVPFVSQPLQPFLPPSPPALRGGGVGGEGDPRRDPDQGQGQPSAPRQDDPDAGQRQPSALRQDESPSPPAPPPRKAGGEGGRCAPLPSMATSPVVAHADAQVAVMQAHAAFLRFTQGTHAAMQQLLARQQQLLFAAPAEWQPVVSDDPPRALNRDQCLAFATGQVGPVLGPRYAGIDAFPTRVRLPDEPLMLVDRITHIEGEPLLLTHGRVVTEHDVTADRWYLDHGRIPTCVAVESGQADLFLAGFLGVDYVTKGRACYRLLDAAVEFHGPLPTPDDTIRYDIRILRFFRQGDTHLFRFQFDATVGGRPLMSMRDGVAGFFTAAELAAGQGIVQTALDKRPRPGVVTGDWRPLVPCDAVEAYSDGQVESLRRGDLAGCFGPAFARLSLKEPTRLPGGHLKLVHRVTELDPTGGRFGLGRIRAEADISPDDWFLTCHFVDDQVMPGTLMYECCLHTLRVYLMRLGWVAEDAESGTEPVPGVSGKLKCRGQVIASTKVVTYEVSVKEIGYRPEPYAVVDALMFADGKPIVEITGMSLRMTRLTRERLEQVWATPGPLYGPETIRAFAVGNPSDAFGEPYRVFDRERVIARLPGPPYQFLDRIMGVDRPPWVLKAGATVHAAYDVPPTEWYFAADRQPTMPFAVLLEVALQPCGWLAAYLGSALTSPTDLSFRNLGGRATQHWAVTPDIGTLGITVTMTRVSQSGGMIIQHYDFAVRDRDGRDVYTGDTYFGFFSKEALANQVGIREATPFAPPSPDGAEAFDYPREAPFPDDRWRMVDRVAAYLPAGGPAGLGWVRGTQDVAPAAWYYTAHFHQDPVMPGSLGLEAFVQLLKVVAGKRWGSSAETTWQALALGEEHRWTYRGQVVPTDSLVTVTAEVRRIDDAARRLWADGWLSVDGRLIYQMNDFCLEQQAD